MSYRGQQAVYLILLLDRKMKKIKIFFGIIAILAALFYLKVTIYRNRDINPEAIVMIRKIQLDSFDYNIERYVDQEKLRITKEVEEISKREEFMDFPQLYKEIEKLNYYNLPPLYWQELDSEQQIKSFQIWEDYMNDLMKRCYGNEIIKFSEKEINHCIELNKTKIKAMRQNLF
jgi:hypothetical protein